MVWVFFYCYDHNRGSCTCLNILILILLVKDDIISVSYSCLVVVKCELTKSANMRLFTRHGTRHGKRLKFLKILILRGFRR